MFAAEDVEKEAIILERNIVLIAGIQNQNGESFHGKQKIDLEKEVINGPVAQHGRQSQKQPALNR